MLWRTLSCGACVVVMAALGVAPNGAAGQPLGICKPGVTDDKLAPLPSGLVARAKQLFGLDIPDDVVLKSTVYRCMGGKTLLCTAGANLVCGKANTSRDLPGVTAWCRDHSGSDDVPAFVTGHDTIYRWHCFGGKPRIAATIEATDSRGFIARNWKNAGPAR
jgi:hypothetical protein